MTTAIPTQRTSATSLRSTLPIWLSCLGRGGMCRPRQRSMGPRFLANAPCAACITSPLAMAAQWTLTLRGIRAASRNEDNIRIL